MEPSKMKKLDELMILQQDLRKLHFRLITTEKDVRANNPKIEDLQEQLKLEKRERRKGERKWEKTSQKLKDSANKWKVKCVKLIKRVDELENKQSGPEPEPASVEAPSNSMQQSAGTNDSVFLEIDANNDEDEDITNNDQDQQQQQNMTSVEETKVTVTTAAVIDHSSAFLEPGSLQANSTIPVTLYGPFLSPMPNIMASPSLSNNDFLDSLLSEFALIDDPNSNLNAASRSAPTSNNSSFINVGVGAEPATLNTSTGALPSTPVPVPSNRKKKKKEGGVMHGKDSSDASGLRCLCGEVMLTAKDFKEHMVYWCVPWKFFCQTCKTFARLNVLKKHQVNVHKDYSEENGGVACRKCGGAFPSRKEHKRHQPLCNGKIDSQTKAVVNKPDQAVTSTIVSNYNEVLGIPNVTPQ